MPRTYRLRWLQPQDATLIARSLVAEALAPDHLVSAKHHIISKLRITANDGETPADAWLRTMCEENNVPFTIPVEADFAQALIESPAYRFYFMLA